MGEEDYRDGNQTGICPFVIWTLFSPPGLGFLASTYQVSNAHGALLWRGSLLRQGLHFLHSYLCASCFIALVTNSHSCWNWDHPRRFPEGSRCWTAELSKQGPRGWKGPGKCCPPGTAPTSQGRCAPTASQPKVKARSGSGRKLMLSREGAGICSDKSHTEECILGCRWSRDTARCFLSHQLPFSPLAVISRITSAVISASNFSDMFLYFHFHPVYFHPGVCCHEDSQKCFNVRRLASSFPLDSAKSCLWITLCFP